MISEYTNRQVSPNKDRSRNENGNSSKRTDVGRRRKKTSIPRIPAKMVEKRQRRHFLLSFVLPLTVTTVWFCIFPSFGWIDLLVISFMWTLTGGLGVSIGFHRYFSHRSFEATPLLQFLMGAAGSMAGQGSITYWVSLHRCHHQHSDHESDPHSPKPIRFESPTLAQRIRAFMHGHMGWVLRHDVPSPKHFAHDCLRDSLINFFDRTYSLWIAIGVLLPGLTLFFIENSLVALGRGMIVGGCLRLLMGNQIIWAVNSLCHTAGDREFETKDSSTNNWLIVLLGFGEGWHNNHHAFPWSARFGFGRKQIDPGWAAIQLFSLLRLASRAKQPNGAQISKLKIHHPV